MIFNKVFVPLAKISYFLCKTSLANVSVYGVLSLQD